MKYAKKFRNREEYQRRPRKTWGDKIPEPSEVRALLAAARKESGRDHALLLIAANTGFRACELTGLGLSNFRDIARNTIWIVRAKRKVAAWDRKFIHEEVAKAIRAYIASLPKGAELLFPSPSGDKPITTRTAENIFNLAARRAGVRPVLSIHSLRHYHGSMLRRAGADQVAIADGLGHASTRCTGRYTHLFNEERADLAAKVPPTL